MNDCLVDCCLLVGPSGLEPPTSCLSGTRSNLLSYEPIRFWVFFSTCFAVLSAGGDDGIRTHDPLLAGQVLSQLSYTPMEYGIEKPLRSREAASVLALTYLPAPSPVKYCQHCRA